MVDALEIMLSEGLPPDVLIELIESVNDHRAIMEDADDLFYIVRRALACAQTDELGGRGYLIGAAAAILARVPSDSGQTEESET